MFKVSFEGMESLEDLLYTMSSKAPEMAQTLANGLANECRNEAVKLVRKRSRFLAHNIHVLDKTTGKHIEVWTHTNKVPYAAINEFGYPTPLVIKPKNKKALYWAGADHPVKSVTIPPREPHPYLRPGAEYALSKLKQLFDKVMEMFR